MPRPVPRPSSDPTRSSRRRGTQVAGAATPRLLLGLLVLIGLLGAGCDTPQWRASAEPDGARLFVDGQERPDQPVEGPVPYYGVVDLAAVPALAERPPRHAGRGQLRIDEPITPWIFPFDFVAELSVALFAADPLRSATLELAERRDLPQTGEDPADLEGFTIRGRRAATGR